MNIILTPPQAKLLTALEACLRSMGSIAVAFSGGLDSRTLVHLARRSGVAVLALHAAGPHIARQETCEALAWARQHGVEARCVPCDPLVGNEVAQNHHNRCYHCKKLLMTTLREQAGAMTLCDGTNASDLTQYRPGLKALRELGVVSPFALAGIDKATIRALAAATGMDKPDQTARPCLLTRFNYNLQADAATLAALDAAEEAIAALFRRDGSHMGDHAGTVDFRLRCITEQSRALHVALPSLSPSLQGQLRQVLTQHGFADAAIECCEQLSGFFDRPAG